MHETHRYCVYENGAHLVYEISAIALDVPFGNRFSVETRIDVIAEQAGSKVHHPEQEVPPFVCPTCIQDIVEMPMLCNAVKPFSSMLNPQLVTSQSHKL